MTEQSVENDGHDGDGGNADSAKGGGEKTFTQSQLTAILERKAREIESKYSGHDELKVKAEQFDALTETAKSDAERLAAATSQRDKLTTDNASLKTQLARQKISATAGLDVELWDRVKGDTDEEIKADVEKLVARFGTTSGAKQVLGPRSGSGASAPDGRSKKQIAADALRGLSANF